MQTVNWIAELNRSAEGLSGREAWNKKVDKSLFADRFADWNFDWLDIAALIEQTDEVFEFPMVDRDPLDQWTYGRVTLLGDAAHPMYPVGSNGASQAILDAAALSSALVSHDSPLDALHAYESIRRPATSRIVLSNRQHGPERVMDMAEQRSPAGFGSASDVFAPGELETISAQYKQVAGFTAPAASNPLR
jgi:2-polyprenyl-6-methoxyphenol hydroxylase-like FAD-dependent oxidoreductase